MKNTFTVLFPMLIFSTFQIHAQEKDATRARPVIKLEVVWEKEFDSAIGDYIVSVNEKREPILRIVSLYKEKTAEVQFINSNGRVSKRVAIELMRAKPDPELGSDVYGGVLTSKNGKYMGVFQVTKRNRERIGEISFQLYDIAGDLLWTKESWNIRPSMLLSDGSILSFEGDPCTWSPFALYADDAFRGWLRPNEGMPMEVTGAFDASENSNIVFNVYDFIRKEGQVVFYDNFAKEIWRRKFDWQWAGRVAVSDSGAYVAAVGQPSEPKIYILALNGELLWEYESGNCELIDYSPDEGYLAAGLNLSNLCLFESTTGKVLWNYELDDNRRFLSIAVSNDGEFVAAIDDSGRRELPEGDTSLLFLLDKDGNLVWQKNLKIQRESAPSVRFTDDGKYVLIRNGNRLHCYKIIRGGP